MALFSLAPLANSMRPLASYPYALNVVNPGAEFGLTGWSGPTSFWSSSFGPSAQGTMPEPNEGQTRYFFAQRFSQSFSTSALTQTIVIPQICHKDIDNNTIRAEFSMIQAAEGNVTTCWLTAQAKLENGTNDNGGGTLEGPDGGSNIWVKKTGSIVLNRGTRAIDLGLRANWGPSNNFNNGAACFDNITLTLVKR